MASGSAETPEVIEADADLVVSGPSGVAELLLLLADAFASATSEDSDIREDGNG